MTDLVSRILNRVDGYLDTTAPLLARDRLRMGVRDVILQAAAEDVKAVSEDAVTVHAREVWEQADRAKTAKLSSGWSSSEDAAVAIIATALLAATREAETERDRLLVLEKDLNIFLNQQCDARLKAEAELARLKSEADAARREQRERLREELRKRAGYFGHGEQATLGVRWDAIEPALEAATQGEPIK